MISLKSKSAQKILSYFFLNPTGRSYINELAKLLCLDPKNTDRKLKELEKEGMLESDFEGKQRYFFLNRDYPLLDEYRKIVLKTMGIEKELRDVVGKDDKIETAYIFGSYAKDSMDANSDIDLLLVGSHSTMETENKIRKLEKESEREINIVSFSREEFERKKNEFFLKNIFKEKIIKIK